MAQEVVGEQPRVAHFDQIEVAERLPNDAIRIRIRIVDMDSGDGPARATTNLASTPRDVTSRPNQTIASTGPSKGT